MFFKALCNFFVIIDPLNIFTVICYASHLTATKTDGKKEWRFQLQKYAVL